MSYRPKKNVPKKQKLRSKPTDAAKPGWDSTINDLTVHKLTSADIQRKKSGRVNREPSRSTAANSKNSKTAVDMKKLEAQHEQMLRSLFSASGRGQSWPSTSERTLEVVRSVFEDRGKRFRGLPNVTRNPDAVGATCRSLPVAARNSADETDSEEWEEELSSHLDEDEVPELKEERPKTKTTRAASAGQAPDAGEGDSAEASARPQAVDALPAQVAELRRLVDALTLELLTANGRLSSLSREFKEYKEASESRIKGLEDQVREELSKPRARRSPSSASDVSDRVELALDVGHTGDCSPALSEPSDDAGGPHLHRGHILAQLEELQRQRDLAQLRLQAIADM